MTLDIRVPEVSFALGVVRQCGALARQVRADMADAHLTKTDLSPVTVADFALQAVVGRALEEQFPADAFVAEERASELRTSEPVLEAVTRFVNGGADADQVCRWIDRGAADAAGRFWVLDPIDGTKGYLRGGQYAVALALIEDGVVQLGVLGCPSLAASCEAVDGEGALVAAVRGQGAWAMPFDGANDFKRLAVSPCDAPAEARLLRSHEAGHTNVSQIDAFAQAMGMQAPPVLMDSQAKYAVLAAGHAEALLRLLSPKAPDYREKIWDQAAGSIVLEEAGGCITDLDGRALDFRAGRSLNNNRGIAASNGRLHDAVLDAIALIHSA